MNNDGRGSNLVAVTPRRWLPTFLLWRPPDQSEIMAILEPRCHARGNLLLRPDSMLHFPFISLPDNWATCFVLCIVRGKWSLTQNQALQLWKIRCSVKVANACQSGAAPISWHHKKWRRLTSTLPPCFNHFPAVMQGLWQRDRCSATHLGHRSHLPGAAATRPSWQRDWPPAKNQVV